MKPAKPQSTRKATAPQLWQVTGVCIFLALAVLAVFGQTAHFEFVGFDDPVYVYENQHVTNGLSLRSLGWALTHAQCKLFHPLTMLSLMVDYQLHGLEAGGYHFTNVLIHAGSSILLFLVLRQMTGALWRSALVAAVFAIHPLRAESVAWISERKDVLAGFFFILTLGAYARYVRKPNSAARYLVVAFCFLLALLSKPTVVTLPFVLLLLDYWPLERMGHRSTRMNRDGKAMGSFWGLVREKIPLLVLAGAVCVATLFAEGTAVASLAVVPLGVRLGNALISYAVYLRQSVWPAGLAAFYPYPERSYPVWEIAGAFLLLAGISWGVLALRRRQPWLLTGWFWYLGMLVPVIGIVQEGSFAHADRNTYLPQIGLWLLAWSAVEVCAGWRFQNVMLGGICAALLAVLAVLAFCARAQTAYWANSELLWKHALACTGRNSFAHYSLGLAFFKKGELSQAIAQYQDALQIQPNFVMARSNLGAAYDQKGDLDEAIAQYRKALELQPDNEEIRVNLANVLAKSGQLNQALEEYQKALAFNPRYADAYYDEGLALYGAGDLEDAITKYREALKIKPDDAGAENNLGMALAKAGRLDEAIECYRGAININRHSADAYDNLGVALIQEGKTKEAIESWQEALQIKPDQISSLNNLAWPLATARDDSLRNGAKAVLLAEQANQISAQGNPIILHTLAAAYAESSRYGEATATARRALELALAQKNNDLGAMLESEIKLYEAGTPVRSAPH